MMQYSPVFEHLFERLISKREKFFSGFRYGLVSPSLSGCHTVRNELIFEGKIPSDRRTRNDLEGSLAFLANFVIFIYIKTSAIGVRPSESKSDGSVPDAHMFNNSNASWQMQRYSKSKKGGISF